MNRKRPFFMIDSTYMVPSNPNTMRDLGPSRNCEYKVVDPDAEGVRKQYKQAELISSRITLKSQCCHRSSSIGNLTARSSSIYTQNNPYNVPRQENVNLVDSRKNISNLVFSPNQTRIKRRLSIDGRIRSSFARCSSVN